MNSRHGDVFQHDLVVFPSPHLEFSPLEIGHVKGYQSNDSISVQVEQLE